MDAVYFLELLYIATAVAVIVFLFRFAKIPRTYITDYMCGLRFVKGAFVNVLGPGTYKPLTRRVSIETVDMRPVPFVMESVSYRDALQVESMVSIGAEILVDNPYLAATSLKNRTSDSLAIVRDTLRTTVSRTITDQSPEFRSKVAEDIQGAVNAELRAVGMKVSNVEVTEIFSRGTSPRSISKGLN